MRHDHNARMAPAAGLAALAIALCFGPALRATAEPAVSAVSGKLTEFGGSHGDGDDGTGVGGLAGSLVLPLGTAVGLQLDGAWARLNGEDFAGTGAHVFWRNPNTGLLGLYGGYAHLTDEGGQDVGRIGVEAQYFTGSLTLDAAAGYRFGDLDDDAYVRAKLDYYVVDDFKMSAGMVYEDHVFALAGAEYQVSRNSYAGAALFAEGRIHDEDRYTVLGGLKIYFGEEMSLIDRHRRQDPDGYLDLDLTATQNAAETARRQRLQRQQQSQSTTGSAGGTGGKKSPSCSFTPDPDTCTRQMQCSGAGYSFFEPGPEACQCEGAFDALCK